MLVTSSAITLLTHTKCTLYITSHSISPCHFLMLREVELTQCYMICGQKSDCMLCMCVVHHFQRHTSFCSLFYHSQLPCLPLQSLYMSTQNYVIADS